MATFKRRLARPREIFLVFSVCAFPIYTWSVLQCMERAPGWLYYLSLWDIMGIVAYVLGAALIESVFLTLGLTLAAALLPRPLFGEQFVATATLIVILLTVTSATLHLGLDRALGLPRAALWVALGMYVGSGAIGYSIVRKKESVSHWLQGLAERLSIFTLLYIPISLGGLLMVAVRNL